MWYSVSLKPGNKEKHPALYARKSSEPGYVLFSNGGHVNFATTVEDAQTRYIVGSKLSDDRSEQIEQRYQWELHR